MGDDADCNCDPPALQLGLVMEEQRERLADFTGELKTDVAGHDRG